MQDGGRYDDYHRELADWEPIEGRPLRSRRRVYLFRVVVVLAIGALVLPGALSTWSLADATAQRACAISSGLVISEAHGSVARFEVFGPGVVSWECYAVSVSGEQWVVSLGAIPGMPSHLGIAS
jgi:hypothetical protein